MQIKYQTYSFSGKSINCYGLEVLKRRLDLLNIGIIPYAGGNNLPVILSLYWPEQIFDFVKWKFKNNIKNQIVAGGNTATTNPSILIPFVDYIFIGDGENWDGTLESDYLINTNRPTLKSISRIEHITPYPYEDLQDARRGFCEISRGCKHKCLFCQYGWLKSYREADIEDIKNTVKCLGTKSIRIFAADRFQHSQYIRIREFISKRGNLDTGSDVSIKFVQKNPEYLGFTKKVRCGVEGMSERLRRLIAKPHTDDEIVNFCKAVADNGIKCLDFYMIYGLPTESREDIKAFRKLIIKLDNVLPEGYVIAIHWNAFTPSAMTPFQGEASAYNYPFIQDMKDLLFCKVNKRIKIYHKPKFTSNWTILKRMLAIRGSYKIKKLIYNIAFNESDLKKHPVSVLKYFKEKEGYNLLEKLQGTHTFPWDNLVVYPKKKMLTIAQHFLKKYGS